MKIRSRLLSVATVLLFCEATVLVASPNSNSKKPTLTPTPTPTSTSTPTPTLIPSTSQFPRGTEGITTASIEPITFTAGLEASRDTFRTRVAWTHYSYNDPIVFPGKEGAAHLHLFFGNALVDHNTTTENIRTNCKSAAAGGTANCSGYWIPALLNAQKNVIPPDFSLWYYKAGYALTDPRNVAVPPVGLKIVQGEASASPSNPQTNSGNPLSGDLGKERILEEGDRGSFFNWNCGDTYLKGKPYIPQDCSPGSVLTLSLSFPLCWNGRDLDSADHLSHMANPNNGECPTSHSVPLPTLSLNIEWVVPAEGTKGWHLSSDMYTISDQTPGGYSTHADWFNGWDTTVFERFNNNCNRALRDCGVDVLGDGFALGSSHQLPMRR